MSRGSYGGVGVDDGAVGGTGVASCAGSEDFDFLVFNLFGGWDSEAGALHFLASASAFLVFLLSTAEEDGGARGLENPAGNSMPRRTDGVGEGTSEDIEACLERAMTSGASTGWSSAFIFSMSL